MSPKLRVYLLPGFFGFANLGEIVYFGHVITWLTQEFKRRGVDAEIFHVLSHPTASIRVRARDLLAELVKTAGDDDGPIHLIGHSTGGLDARLFVTPDVNLSDDGTLPSAEPFARRVKSVICLATPHHGTGIASFFSGLMGAKLLGLLSLFTVYVLRFGRVPLSLAMKVAGTFVRMDSVLGWRETLVDQLFNDLLADFSKERRGEIAAFFQQVRGDQALVTQLTPEGIDVFNAGVGARPGVRYGSVVTQARPPSLKTRWSTGWDPYAQATHNLYAFLYRRARTRPASLSDEHRDALVKAYGLVPGAEAGDGIVPTLSQPWGEVIAAVWADHLDVIGHFDGPQATPPHVDWLISATGFRRPQFAATWTKVTDFLLRD